jgi:hypothetical protein
VKREYKIEIERDGRWWMVHIPELDGLTQARRLNEAALMGREWIAVSTGTPLVDVAVSIASITVPEVGDIHAAAENIQQLRAVACRAELIAAEAMRRFVRALTAADIPVRDAGYLLGVSPQRISQLANDDEKIEDLKDRLSVYERTGETISADKLRAELGLDG